MKRVSSLAVFLLLGLAGAAQAADQIVFVVRHAERAPATPTPAGTRSMLGGDDPPLSTEGRARAVKLAAMLASADVKSIFTTEFERTRETAAPLAAKLKIQPIMSAAKDPSALVETVRNASGHVLIVGHSNTVPDLLKRLGVKEPITIADAEYDNLFVVVRRDAGETTLVRLRY